MLRNFAVLILFGIVLGISIIFQQYTEDYMKSRDWWPKGAKPHEPHTD